MSDIFGVDNVTKWLDFEKKVIGSDGNTKRIDVYIPEMQVLIEQKSRGSELRWKAPQAPDPSDEEVECYEFGYSRVR